MSDLITSSAFTSGSNENSLGSITDLFKKDPVTEYLNSFKLPDYLPKVSIGNLPATVPNSTNNTEGLGLGKWFSDLTKEGGFLSNLGTVAGVGKGLLDIYSVGSDLFGSGKRDRKESKDMMRKAFNQNYAMNEMAINKFKEDNENFRAGQARAKASFEAPNPFRTA